MKSAGLLLLIVGGFWLAGVSVGRCVTQDMRMELNMRMKGQWYGGTVVSAVSHLCWLGESPRWLVLPAGMMVLGVALVGWAHRQEGKNAEDRPAMN